VSYDLHLELERVVELASVDAKMDLRKLIRWGRTRKCS